MAEFVIRPVSKLKGIFFPPGDKSISHRAVIIGSLARGKTEVHRFLRSEDCLRIVQAFVNLGVKMEMQDDLLVIDGVGLDGLQEPQEVLDFGNSGTGLRLTAGVLAGQPFYSVITGDSSLRKRPMRRIVEPLCQMGARIYGRQEGNLPPLSIIGGNLRPLNYFSPMPSAQVKSAILLAGLFAQGETSVTEPIISRDHTERMLIYLGCHIKAEKGKVIIKGRPHLTGRKVMIPGDISAAAFFLVAAAIIPGSELTIVNVGVNPTRTGIIDVLKNMGANLEILNYREESGEPIADLHIKSSPLCGVVVEGEIIPRLIDEIPAIAVAATRATGTTIIRDAGELRVKESDRLAAMTRELTRMGARIEETETGLVISGGNQLRGTLCESYSDHRVAMALAIAGLVAKGETRIKEAEFIATSFPDFFSSLENLCYGRT